MRTQIGIIGAGPAGLFLSHLLAREGVESVILEARERSYVETRARAGVLEQATVDVMTRLGVDGRLRKESLENRTIDIRFGGKLIHLDLPALTGGKSTVIYGQQEVVKDLIAARVDAGGVIEFGAQVVGLNDMTAARPQILYERNGQAETLTCDFIVGCDGSRSTSRDAIPAGSLTVYERQWPFGWLGILSESPPLPDMTYANHEHGFALYSRRSPQISRLYLQCGLDDDLAEWPDERIWSELRIRATDQAHTEIIEGPILQRAVTPVRAVVVEPMRYGRLFLAGDAAHVMPPTGAKGLNLAVADAHVLARAMGDYFRTGKSERIDRYSQARLTHVWKAVRYAAYMTAMLHRFDSHTPFDRQLQLAELEFVASNRAASMAIAENYVGLPFQDD